MKHSGKEIRIGTLLVDRGLITNDQLQSAIEIQCATHKQLGEILIEQKIITRPQLNRSLRRQKLLRNTIVTALLSIAPFQMVIAKDHRVDTQFSAAQMEQQQIQNFDSFDYVDSFTSAKDVGMGDSVSVSDIMKGMQVVIAKIGIDSPFFSNLSLDKEPEEIHYDMDIAQDGFAVTMKITF
ncbi:hypothetical protein A9Q81_15980 [Gammaproteobacteria bacterium 42_54_T18]|nr:hypothetical protein A9Q81_15980 [Gammaproteobacteria bacterium 42_54_T18]